jgi:two-component system chemotaxis response regulator CheB
MAGRKIRVLVVDDSPVIRRLVRHALEADPNVEVVGASPNGNAALVSIPQLNPDVVTLDIEMPEMDGLEFLRRMRPRYPGIRVVMLSALTERGASATLEALACGADDYVTKVSNVGGPDTSVQDLTNRLLPKIRQFFRWGADGAPVSATPKPFPAVSHPEVALIGVSTGGPAALAKLFSTLPRNFRVPILIVQHMPAIFTRLLAERLDSQTHLTVREGAHGDPVKPGCAYVAPGDYHMKLARQGREVVLTLDQSMALNSCRPAVDALFISAAEVYGGRVLATVLTGMGEDGLRGAASLKAQGARVIVQDEASSVVWGMPRAVSLAGLADETVPLNEMAAALARLCTH